MSACCASRPAKTTRSTTASWPTTCAPRSRMPKCCTRAACSRQADLVAIRDGLERHCGWRMPVASGRLRSSWRMARPRSKHCSRERIGEAGARLHAGRSRNDQVLAALRLYLRDAIETLADDAALSPQHSTASPTTQGAIPLPGYTHMQQAMPSSVALWAGGFAAEIRDDAIGLRHAQRRLLEESAGVRRGLWHTGPARRSRRHTQPAGIHGEPRAGHRGPAIARQRRKPRCCSRSRC